MINVRTKGKDRSRTLCLRPVETGGSISTKNRQLLLCYREPNDEAVRLACELKLEDTVSMIRMYRNGQLKALSRRVFAITCDSLWILASVTLFHLFVNYFKHTLIIRANKKIIITNLCSAFKSEDTEALFIVQCGASLFH